MEPINSITERIARDFIPPETPVTPLNPVLFHNLNADPNCPICHGTGLIKKGGDPDDPTSGHLEACECRKRLLEQNSLKAKTASANLNGYEQMTFDTFCVEGRGQLREEQVTNLTYARDFARKYAEDPSGWLFFTGRYGTGKTHLAAAIANEALRKGMDLIFQPVPDLLDRFAALAGRPEETDEVLLS